MLPKIKYTTPLGVICLFILLVEIILLYAVKYTFGMCKSFL